MPRDRPRTRDSSSDEDQYIILVKDIPRHCRWQELKDMTRSLGGEQSLKAEVFELQDGSQLGHCTIKGRVAANQVYEKFCNQGWNGQGVCVSLAVLEKPGVLKTLEGPKKTSGARVETRVSPKVSYPGPATALASSQSRSERPSDYAGDHSPASKTYSVRYERQTSTTARPPVPSYAPTTVDTRLQGGAAPLAYSYQTVSPYPTSSSTSVYAPPVVPGTQVATNGYYSVCSGEPQAAAAAPSRTINDGSTVFISGLPHNQSEPQLRNLLKRYGSLIYLEIHPDSRNPGKVKGTARGRYRTPAEALHAVRNLDGAYLSDRKISVKQTKGGSEDVVLLPTDNRMAAPAAAPQKKKITPKPTTTSKQQPAQRGRHVLRGSDSGSVSPSTGPLIVNGARRRSARNGMSSSDDDSSEDGRDTPDSDSSENETAIRTPPRRKRGGY
ncbi:hypothetical protein LTR10_019399 [Elasticomyces elasticus]|uniref:RRM domain-containing protein n=1 Tax=Exophiala sideris TaxID=1016849 RepID=A0ABR0IVZ0_9EURO|nr:hypothetical protein LTR10_019399 [Elasticomyces elasticus]KAK5021440.1 hypothetical protein LTS07_011050 [Exophiala sideris]KAK5025438.1 hypothetical protein LTR13_010515 [Exophiala sideris]KAK5049289.1 hypothetical protein LTR69_011074 [Exophiala sideris]KAK5176962.1 hypothetical protein LTR44_010535 [Eurotiomycetes sp. CCFEE 6388]